MKKTVNLLMVALATTLTTPAYSKSIPQQPLSSCSAMVPYGMPSSKSVSQTICRTAYIVGYDGKSKIPNWVSYVADEKSVIGCQPRANEFYTDETLNESIQSKSSDYAKTGYDIGHMANASDMASTLQTETESFLMSNMTPQKPGVNRAVWKSIETAVRTWAISRHHKLVIISGSVYTSSSKKIGNGVVVPDSIYKIIIDETTKEYLAFNVSQTNTPKEIAQTQTTISAIEQLAGITIMVPAGLDKTRKSAIWDISYSAYQASKKQTCKVN